MSVAADYRRWLRQKQYTFEVTFALNMFRSWEKSVIYSVLFLLISMTLIAAILYLPHHITLLAGRAWYYIQGDHINIAVSTSDAIKVVSATVAEVLPTGETVKEAVARTLEKEL